jgi:hypothetical protein
VLKLDPVQGFKNYRLFGGQICQFQNDRGPEDIDKRELSLKKN